MLRRHLSLQVNELVGKYIVQEKRNIEISVDFVPLSPTMKVKKSKFPPLRKKKWQDEDFLCPLEWDRYPFQDEAGGDENGMNV